MQGLMRISDFQRRRILQLIKHFRVASTARRSAEEIGSAIIRYLMFFETTEAMSSAAWMTLEFIS